ncbi:MAG: hypothetical protein LBR70_00005 [Lactobacillaceae bacterium]|jgi:hypothetical protein|nr:hypothetical protein [Lactobacillaceae bacterium]
MKFDFFTFGGRYCWEDLFIYQNWRIQRHYLYKDYRLLDSFDIRRESGTFEKCHKTFLEFVKAYEMEKQKDQVVILLHGLNESKDIFDSLKKKMAKENYLPMSVNYPSTKKNIDSNVRQLNVLMNNLADATQVSFIAKGIGGIILRKLIASNEEWKKRIKVKRVIQVSPPNKGSRFLTKLSEYAAFKWKLGPVISELSPKKIEKMPVFPKNIDLGIIHCDYPFKKAAAYLPKKIRGFLPSQVEGDIDSPNKSIYISNTKRNVMDNEKIVNACIRFLKDGLF